MKIAVIQTQTSFGPNVREENLANASSVHGGGG